MSGRPFAREDLVPKDSQDVAAEVSKRRKGMIAALVAILIVMLAIVGMAYTMELGPFAPTVTPADSPQQTAKPSKESSETSIPVSVSLPAVEAQEAMFWEQMASAETIQELVDDKFATFELGDVATKDGTVEIRVKATYRDATSISGSMVMREYDKSWFFASITRDGHSAATPVTGEADPAVAKAIAEGNAANQEIPVAVIDGGHKLITIEKVTKGSGTAIIDATFSGGSAATAKGQITCIAKQVGGVTHWFITGFALQ